MRVAALYDIHGNMSALDAVLDEIRGERIDRVVVGGDVFPGPMAAEVLARLRGLDVPVDFIRGNGESAVLAVRAGRPVALPEQVLGTLRWSAQHLDGDQARFLATWPLTHTLNIEGVGTVLFCHATPRDDNEIFAATTSAERLAGAFANVDAALVVCGHTHMQFDRRVGPLRVVNAGSVGMPFGDPGAFWLRLGPGVELRRTMYDLAAAAERIRATPYPDAADFAARYILDRPSAQQMAEVFARAELKT